MSIASSIPSQPPSSIPLQETPSSLPLPHELIDRIIAYHATNLPVLLALASTSRRLYHRTVPVLYRNPFAFIENGLWPWTDKVERYNQLLGLLLSSLGSTTTTSTTPRPSQAPMCDYLAFYAHQRHLDTALRLAFSSLTSYSNLSGMAMVAKVGFDHAADESLLEQVSQSDVAMVGHNPAAVKTLGQPLRRLRMFVGSVQSLSNLTRIELYGIGGGGGGGGGRGNNGTAAAMLQPNLEPTIEFIRVHDAVHSTLREIKLGGSYDYGSSRNYALTRLIRVIQVMRTPQVVDVRHWREAHLVIDQIPPDSLHELYLGFGEMPPIQFAGAEYLQHCRYLERLRMPIIDQDLFKWAAEWRRTGMQPKTVALLQQQDDEDDDLGLGVSDRRQRRPPRLRSVDLTGEDRVLIPVLKDVMSGFRDTIESIQATTLALENSGVCHFSAVRLKWAWTIRTLRELVLEGEVVLALDFGSLVWCPTLSVLRLTLPPYLFLSSEDEEMARFLRPESEKLCLAVRLNELELGGKWPLTDKWLDRLSKNMNRLTELRIASSTGYTMQGIQWAAERLTRLERLHVGRWMFVSPTQRQQLEQIRADAPRLTIVEQ
ncbi:hypothetical protein DFQ27_007512 [Actinomortierella ambigua]|uniref:Uncharacterized protein n=1 Tax=Actinomortierella ambigua TaxID=1343610 RepID=A0A9P6PTH3_9FUNG|nr:hypothetical protein DFQ27_007512 [Actinomortierella ambigua]